MKPVLRKKDKGTALERYYKSFLHVVDGIIYAFKYSFAVTVSSELRKSGTRLSIQM